MDVQRKTERTFWGKVAIVGPTGSGKSYLTKTADKNHIGFLNVENKPLPYKAEPFKFQETPKNWADFSKNLDKFATSPDVSGIIIDSQTMAFAMLNNEMQKNFTNWDIAKNYNKKVYDYLVYMKGIEKDVIVFSHDEMLRIGEGGKQKRMVVHNKEHEGKIEEHFTIVLYTGTRIVNGKPQYFLRTFEEDTSTKCPEGLFPDKDGNNLLEIPNDAQYIFSCLEKYYSK